MERRWYKQIPRFKPQAELTRFFLHFSANFYCMYLCEHELKMLNIKVCGFTPNIVKGVAIIIVYKTWNVNKYLKTLRYYISNWSPRPPLNYSKLRLSNKQPKYIVCLWMGYIYRIAIFVGKSQKLPRWSFIVRLTILEI